MRVQRPRALHRVAQATITLTFLFTILFFTSACGDTRIQQLASSTQQQFEQLVTRAQQIGVPVASLQSTLKLVQQIQMANAPFNLLDARPIDTYYQAQTARYAHL